MKKLDVDVEVTEDLDLFAFFSTGKLEPNEKPLPEDEDQQTPPPAGSTSNIPELKKEIVNGV